MAMTVLRRVLALGLFLIAGLIACLAMLPSPVDPEPYTPGVPRPLSGALVPNDALCRAEMLSTGDHVGPEDLLVEDGGRVTGGMRGGTVVRLVPGPPQVLARTGGRPLGLARDSQGRLLIADADKGLLRQEPDGTLTTLATGAGGRPCRFTNELAVASGGRIFFSDSSDRWSIADFSLEVVEGRPRGRILMWDLSGAVTVLADGLHFPNGVALTPDENALLFTQSTRFCVSKLHLTGPGTGRIETLIDALPGFPDNLSRTARGTYWIALFSLRDPLLDLVGPHAWARSMVAKLPRRLWEDPKPYGFALEIDGEGRILRTLQDPSGTCFPEVTSAVERDGHVWLGTLRRPYLARVALDIGLPHDRIPAR
jgi:sugar lactone lactonase YvrE